MSLSGNGDDEFAVFMGPNETHDAIYLLMWNK